MSCGQACSCKSQPVKVEVIHFAKPQRQDFKPWLFTPDDIGQWEDELNITPVKMTMDEVDDLTALSINIAMAEDVQPQRKMRTGADWRNGYRVTAELELE